MEIHATPGADRKATEARFSVMQFSLKDEHKIPGYDTFRSVFNMDPDERSDEDCDKLRPLLETVGSFHLLLSDRDMLLKLCRALKLVTIPWGGVDLMREGDRGVFFERDETCADALTDALSRLGAECSVEARDGYAGTCVEINQ